MLTIDGELSIRNAVELRDRLAAALRTEDELIVDWGAVSDCDTAALQLLASFRKTAAARGRAVRFQGEPVAVSKLAEALGMPIGALTGAGEEGEARGL